jgi:hypothetical protein
VLELPDGRRVALEVDSVKQDGRREVYAVRGTVLPQR